MNVIRNLVDNQFIKPGTWVGIDTSQRKVLHRFIVEKILSHGDIIAIDVQNNSRVKFCEDLIVEIDGMKLERFLQQADLNNQGLKITGIKRRGRKPVVRN